MILNESYFVQRFCLEHEVIFERDENWFYTYNKATGAWGKVLPEAVKEMFRADWEAMAHEEFNEPKLETKNSDRFLNSVVSGIKAHAGKHGAFPRLEKTIHCANGMLLLTVDGNKDCLVLKEHSPSYMSRNPIPLAWEGPEVKAPQFEAILNTLPG